MPEVSAHIRQFFQEYEEGANAFNVELNVRERYTSWLSAGPSGVALLHNDDRFPELLKQRQKQLADLGFQSATITSLAEIVLDEHYSLVKTAWRQTYKRAGKSTPIDITVDYVVRIEDDRTVKIICTIAHEDEALLLRDQGIV